MTGNARSKLRRCNVCDRKAISTSNKCTKTCKGRLEIMSKNPNKNIKKLGDLK